MPKPVLTKKQKPSTNQQGEKHQTVKTIRKATTHKIKAATNKITKQHAQRNKQNKDEERKGKQYQT